MREGVTRELLEANAGAGAAWLDQVRPGWWEDVKRRPADDWPYGGIDLTRFDMESASCCVGGWLEGDYGTFRREYQLSFEQAANYGFTLPNVEGDDPIWDTDPAGDFVDEEYRVLTEVWRLLIARRRDADTERRRVEGAADGATSD